jgi:hypothetical protein
MLSYRSGPFLLVIPALVGDSRQATTCHLPIL